MEATLLQVFPAFAIMLAGYLTAKFRYLGEGVCEALAQFVFLVAVPVYVFRTMVRSSLLDTSLGNLVEFLVVYFLSAVGAIAVGILVARFALNRGEGEQLRMGIAGSQSNAILLGIPAVLMILDSKAISALVLLVGLHGMVMALLVTLAIRILTRKGEDLMHVLVRYAKSPILIALVAGIVAGKLDVRIPEPADEVLRGLIDVMVPCALFALGGTLVRLKVGGEMPVEVATAAVKLVAFPLIVWALAIKLPWFSIPNSWAWAAVMVAAMPVGIELHAKGKRAGAEVAGSTVLTTTVMSVVTITVLTHLIRG